MLYTQSTSQLTCVEQQEDGQEGLRGDWHSAPNNQRLYY